MAVWLLASAAWAQSAPAREVKLARELFRQGAAHATAERWEEAEVAFAGSLALYERPRTRYNLAVAREELGRWVEAAEDYRRYVREADAEREGDRLKLASQAVERLDAQMPRLTVQASGLQDGDALILDGSPMARAALGYAQPLDPGSHTVRIQRAGEDVASASVDLSRGAQEVITLSAPAPPVPTPAAVAARAPAPPSAPAPEQPHAGTRRPWVWWTVGAAVLVAVAGGVAIGVVASQDSGPQLVEGNVSPNVLSVQ